MVISQYFEYESSKALNKAIYEVYPERMIMGGFAASLKEETAVNTGNALLPFNTSVESWRDDFHYDVYTSTGIAEFYSHASDDIPQVGMGRQTFYGRMKEVIIGDSWTSRQLERDRAMGGNMIANGVKLARRGTDIKLEDIFYQGEPAHRLYGLLNFPGTTVSTLPNDGAGSLTTFASKTTAQNYRDLVTMGLSVSSASKNAFAADTMVIPQSVYNKVSTEVLTGVTTTGSTTLEIVLRNMANNPFGIRRIIPNAYLDGKGTVPGSGVGFVYSSKADNIEAFLSDYMREYRNSSGSDSNDGVNYKHSINWTSVTGGVVCYQPMSFVKFDSI